MSRTAARERAAKSLSANLRQGPRAKSEVRRADRSSCREANVKRAP